MSRKELQRRLKNLWTVQETARRFRVSQMSIFTWRTQAIDPLPCLDIPGSERPTIRFIPSEVRAWAKRNGRDMYERDVRKAA